MAVLKQTSPTAWPSAPRPKPSSTVPSASTRSAVGLWSGQAEALSVVVMNPLHSRRARRRQSRKAQIHMRNADNLNQSHADERRRRQFMQPARIWLRVAKQAVGAIADSRAPCRSNGRGYLGIRVV